MVVIFRLLSRLREPHLFALCIFNWHLLLLLLMLLNIEFWAFVIHMFSWVNPKITVFYESKEIKIFWSRFWHGHLQPVIIHIIVCVEYWIKNWTFTKNSILLRAIDAIMATVDVIMVIGIYDTAITIYSK